MYGPYPYNVKLRIKSDHGHLSNVRSGETLARLLDERRACDRAQTLSIMLAHLSEKNNTPYQARLTIEEIMKAHGYEADRDYIMTIAAVEGLTSIGKGI